MRQLLALLMLTLSLGQGGMNSLVDQTSLGGPLYLVNRTYRLSEQYVPQDLVMPQVRRNGSSVLMRPEAATQLEAMFAAAAEEGHKLMAISGFRSFETQRLIYRRKIDNVGSVARAQLLVAPPGASEHQLGLAMDVGRQSSAQLSASFGKSPEGQWVARNAHLYGFIVRYQAQWTAVTGYADEPWHLRYIGPEHAQAIWQLNLPLETYVEMLSMMHLEDYYQYAAN